MEKRNFKHLKIVFVFFLYFGNQSASGTETNSHIYKNIEFGISFQKPANWIFEDIGSANDTGTIRMGADSQLLSIIVREKTSKSNSHSNGYINLSVHLRECTVVFKKCIREYIENDRSNGGERLKPLGDFETVQISGRPALKVVASRSSGKYQYYFVEHEKVFFMILVPPNSELEPEILNDVNSVLQSIRIFPGENSWIERRKINKSMILDAIKSRPDLKNPPQDKSH